MATNGIPITVSDNSATVSLHVDDGNMQRSLSGSTGNSYSVPISVAGVGTKQALRSADNDANASLNSESRNPYYVGARAYVTQTESGAVITVIDREGTTTAVVNNGSIGEDGVGIASIVLNQDYTLTILLTDGTSVTTPSIRGEKGDKGDKGDSADIDSITNAELEEMLV